MTKKIFACLLVLLPLVQLTAQREYLPTAEDLNRFHKTKTYVVLSDNAMADYNFEISDAIEKFWTITDFEFIKHKDFAEKSVDSNASFLYVATVSFEKDKSQTRYTFLCLSLGGPDHENIDELHDITNVPLSYYGVDEDEYTYKLGLLVRFMQQHVQLITEDPKLVSQNVFQYYNDNMSSMQGKTLYVTEEDLPFDLATEAKVRAVYPYDFHIVEREKIKELIMEEDENAVVLHKVGPQSKIIHDRVYKILMGTSDAKFYYYDYHKSNKKKPDAFLKSDFERLSRAVPK